MGGVGRLPGLGAANCHSTVILQPLSRIAELQARHHHREDATEGALQARTLTFKGSTKGKIGLLLEARDGTNNLVAAHRRTL